MMLVLWIVLLLSSIVGLLCQRSAQTADKPRARMVVSVALVLATGVAATQIIGAFRRTHRPVSISDINQIPNNPSGFATDGKSAWFGAQLSAGVFRLYRFTPSEENEQATPLDPEFASVPRQLNSLGPDAVIFIAKDKVSQTDKVWTCKKDVIEPIDLAPEGSLLAAAGSMDAPFLVMESNTGGAKVVKVHHREGREWKMLAELEGHPGGPTLASADKESVL